LSTIIKTLRESKGLTQAQVAKEVGVSQQAVVQWEAGDTAPRGKNLLKAAEVLGTDVKTLKSNKSADGVDIVDFKQATYDILMPTAKGMLAIEVKKSGHKWQFDYCSDTFAMEVVPGDDANKQHVMHSLWQLATYHAATGKPTDLIIVGEPDRAFSAVALQKLTAQAALLGVQVFRTSELDELPALLSELQAELG
jgi:transcriptional regulator with XRE-family HTH domain